VQDGCDYKCTFCTIPQARGKSRNAEITEVVAQAKSIGQLGVKEIVLTGVNIGDFGKGNFITLIKSLDQVEEISRYRISSIEPNLCTDEIIDFVSSSERFMPHFHMPLQSGNNEILGKMRRRYKRELYAERVDRIRSQMSHACIGVDLITGCPGESDFHFEDTLQFIEDLEIDYIHAFTYSERENTPAATMPDAVPIHVRRERSNVLRNLSLKKKAAHYSRHIGERRKVLFENTDDSNSVSGFTDNYIRVCVNDSSFVNTIRKVELHQLHLLKGDPVVWSSLQQPETAVVRVCSNHL
jgi:threonylcarbamoyladenosine tRNA methylthiotransferase MtaB